MTDPDEFVDPAVDRVSPEAVAAVMAIVDGPVLPEVDVPGFGPPCEVDAFDDLGYDLPDPHN